MLLEELIEALCIAGLEENESFAFKLGSFDHDSLEAVVKAYVEKKECKNGQILWPLRTAVSGKQMTPGGAYEIMEILGKDESIERIKTGIKKLS